MDVGGYNLRIFLLFVTSYLTSYGHGQLVVNVEISGRYVVKTGVKTYAVYRHWDDTRYEFVDIFCSSATSFPSLMSIFKDGKLVKANSSLGSGKSFLGVKKYYNYSSVEELAGEYTCSLDISTLTSGGTFVQYSVLGKADIAIRLIVPICASSVGNSAYVGEKVSFKCEHFDFGTLWWYWNTTLSNVTEFSITGDVSQMSCGTYIKDGSWYGKCLSPKLLVFSSLKINLWKINVTSNMEFHCNSTPPRLLYWTIIGTLGNILDYDSMDQSVLVNTSVVIRQSVGKSSLHISEEIPGGNGISMITCSSYDTQAHEVASIRLQPFATEDSRFENASLQPTENASLYHRVNTTTIEHNVCACDLEGNGRKIKCDKHVSFAVVFPLLGVILILFIVIVFLYLRVRKLSNFNAVIEAPFRSQLHKTEAYVSYS